MSEASMDKKTAALVALLLASAGGGTFLLHHPKPTLKDVFLACEQGKLTGMVCCEDMNKADVYDWENSCGMITPENHDPFGTRKQEENAWDSSMDVPDEVAKELNR
jgi:hypothetical protein